MAVKRTGLGKGLEAIFMENTIEDKNNTVTLNISEIEPNRAQPRRDFDDEALAELAESINQHGILQPLLVRPLAGGGYQIVAGERRFRACRLAGISEVPVLIRDLDDKQTMELALIENLQREDLSPIEEAKGYCALIEKYGFTQEEVSKSIGKSRPYITNSIRLLNLPEDIIEMISQGKISSGHGRTLLSAEQEGDMRDLAKLICEDGISVRKLEKLVKVFNSKRKREEPQKNTSEEAKFKRATFFDEVELALNEHLCRRVRVIDKDHSEKGIIEIEFYNQEDLADIARRLAGKE